MCQCQDITTTSTPAYSNVERGSDIQVLERGDDGLQKLFECAARIDVVGVECEQMREREVEGRALPPVEGVPQERQVPSTPHAAM
eukprot:2006097-Rhodomonas_salina.3